MRASRQILPLLLLAAMLASSAEAEIVVVVNPNSGVETLSRDEVINIFLGRFRQFPNGLIAQPIDQPAGQPGRARFYRLLVDKDLAEINAYWARLIFSGKTSPPLQAASDAEVVEWVSKHREAIGYIDKGEVDSRVRVVMDFSR